MKKLPCVLADLVMMVSAVALAELCPKCKNQSYTKDIGKCSQCGGPTSSGQFQLCMKCSAKLNQCEHCLAPLSASQPATQPSTSPAEKIDTGSDGTYKSGLWEYRYSIGNKGSRSEGCFGDLVYGGKDVPVPQEINDHILTPWGMMYWIGNRPVAFGAHGWMLKPSPSGESGRLLADPSGSAPAVAGGEVMLACRRAMLECQQMYFNLFAAYKAKRVNEDDYKKGLELYNEARLATDELGKELAVARDEAETALKAPGGRDKMNKGVGDVTDAAIEKARQIEAAAIEKARQLKEALQKRMEKLQQRVPSAVTSVRG